MGNDATQRLADENRSLRAELAICRLALETISLCGDSLATRTLREADVIANLRSELTEVEEVIAVPKIGAQHLG